MKTNSITNKFSTQVKVENWKRLRNFLKTKNFLIDEEETRDIIHFRSGKAYDLMLRLYQFLTGKEATRTTTLTSNGTEKGDELDSVPHYLNPTFSNLARQDFLWAEPNYRKRKITLLQNLEHHRIFLIEQREKRGISKFIKAKKMEKKNIQKIDRKGKRYKLGKVPTETELIELKNYKMVKGPDEEITYVIFFFIYQKI